MESYEYYVLNVSRRRLMGNLIGGLIIFQALLLLVGFVVLIFSLTGVI